MSVTLQRQYFTAIRTQVNQEIFAILRAHMQTLSRTLIGSTPSLVGETVKLQGWVKTKRDHGKITFVDLRDRSGVVQCVGYQLLGDVTTESVIEIEGLVKARPERLVNKDLPTGTIEIDVKS